MTDPRFARYEERARRRMRACRATYFVAVGFDRADRAEMWSRLRTKNEAWADYLWSRRVEGTRPVLRLL